MGSLEKQSLHQTATIIKRVNCIKKMIIILHLISHKSRLMKASKDMFLL